MMWIRKIARRKSQFAVILLLSMLTTVILTACVSFTVETHQFVKEYYSLENSPICFAVSGREDAAELLEKDKKASQVIAKLIEGNAKYIEDDFYANDKKIPNEGNYAYGVADFRKLGYPINIIQGEEKKAPDDREIWLSHIFAKAYDIHVGDDFKIGSEEYKVSAIVYSSLCSSGFIDSYPFYMNETMLGKLDGAQAYAVSLYTNQEDISLREFFDRLPEEYKQSITFMMDRETLKMCLNILTGIFGGVGVAAAIIIAVVSMVVFRYLVRATIAKEYQMIGIYKALGRDSREIQNIYLTAYMISGLIGILPGFFLARPLAKYFGTTALGGNSEFGLTGYSIVIGLIVTVFMALLLFGNIRAELKKVKSISPIQAMNLMNLSSEEKLCKSVIPNAASSASMAINGLFKRKGMTLLVIMILTISVYMDVVAGEVALTLSNYANDRNIWENLPAYDCMVKTTMGSEDGLNYVRESDDVEEYVQTMLSPQCQDMKIEGTKWTADEAHPMIYENFTEERYQNVPFTKGRICTEKHEIAASEQFLTEVGKKVGDYIKISSADKEINFLIVGSYSAMMKGGASFYMQEADFKELGFTVNYDTILVFLKDHVSYENFVEKFEQNVEKCHIYKDFNFVEREGDTVREIANPICGLLFMAFMAFSILNIVNLVHTNMKENRRKYGILKAMGFTTGYICRENIFSLLIQYAVAIVITILLNEWLSPILFSLACGVRYICKPAWLVAAVAAGIFVILMTITLCLLQSVKKIQPVELMEE